MTPAEFTALLLVGTGYSFVVASTVALHPRQGRVCRVLLQFVFVVGAINVILGLLIGLGGAA